MAIANTIALLGGLAFFLFGMSLLGEGLKRVAAHCSNIAITILESQDSRLKSHDYVGSLDRNDQNTYELQRQVYKTKYVDRLSKNEIVTV